MSRSISGAVCYWIMGRPMWLRIVLYPALVLARKAVVRQALASDDGMMRLLQLLADVEQHRGRR
jgi:hypothetical protein